MSKHLFRILFGTLCLVSASVFTGCSDDDEKSLVPELTASPETLTFSEETETVQTISVKANCEWTVVKTDLDWATVEPMSGKGNATITVSVSEMASGLSERSGKIAFSLIHPEFGKWGEAESTVTVKQYASGVTPPPTGDPIYANNFDKEQATQTYGDGSSWPYLDQFEGWKNESGTGISAVTYSFNGMSARANSPSNNNYSKYEGSGVNNLLFGSNNEFVIGKITLDAAQKNLCLTFGSYLSEVGASDNAFDASKFHVSLSKDGDNWVEITYDRPVADDEHSQYGTWALATANFTLKEVPAELYIKFNADIASSYRMDDVTLLEGVGGQEVDLNYVAPTTGAKIGEIKTAGKYKTAGTVVARGKLAYIIADETGAMMVYHKENERAVGDKISIEGEVTIYNEDSTPQFSEDAVVTVESTGNAWTYNPTVCDASAMDQLLSVDPVCTEIQFTGTLSIDGNYVNVAIDGASKAIGSVKYIDNTTISDLDGAVVVVKGYFVGTSSGKYVNVLPYSIEAAGEVPPSITVNPTSLTFAAAGEAKTVTVTKKNADDCTIEASADNEQFTVEVSGDQVNVTAKENTAEEAISGTLTVKLMKAGEAVATATVALKQNGVSQGGETKTFTSMDIFTCTEDDSAAKAYTLGNQSTFNGEAASGVKLGTSSAAGYFTSQAVGVTGAKKLSFYAVAWKGKSATIYLRVNNGGSVSTASVDLAANDGATGNPPFTITVTDSDYYTFDLTDLTEASTVTISTSADFDTASSSAPRAVIAGIQLY